MPIWIKLQKKMKNLHINLCYLYIVRATCFIYISHIPALYSRLNPVLSVEESDWNRIVIADPLEVKMDVSRTVPVSDASSLASFESPS